MRADVGIRAMGMRPIVVDAGSKKKLCMDVGAEEFVDFTQTEDVAAKIKEIADGIGAHGVLVTAYQSYKGELLAKETFSPTFVIVLQLD